ncbi:Xylose isomerase domain protein TIM barrel OS=Solibacter usitatus (strain Ellin6076) GN=Acid_7683 PE=4 SV=1: AP_endonuc_2 [Gemmataceae bacterium]|nr:Xylose isomerase domain protein TIM barrel OS=Solibacter usitatus (strain Ellin6076) GN=Acid_7683 PE=4 SV=1: AP_endonuc_2 [Gemmataceae bacterium]VTU02470.1 Xylose isomerase domain protein TIM barrel OS=Solibacter usitatus (strain Ellin6076) GN=Acid_7683 PE=4 SV=1: AP_endonuc_2 [Gemmataceae bacterium]
MSSRRIFLKSVGTVTSAALVASSLSERTRAEEDPNLKGRVKQSVVFWCFNARGDKWSIDKTCEVAKGLGCPSVELAGPETWDTIKKHGLVCAIAPNGMPGAPFMRGFNNTQFHAEIIERTGKTIDACADAKFPSVIAFVGYKWTNPDDPKSAAITQDDAFANCVKGLKELARHAEKKGVTVCVEHLNTRDSSDPMKGHPGYQGDDLDFVSSVLRKVGSPRIKLLFDIYHVQLMHGDLIRRIEQNKDVIGHVHTAGVPGRGELDENQEVNYPAVMKKLIDIGYTGYVGQEFIPTRDPLAGLKQAVKLCDV